MSRECAACEDAHAAYDGAHAAPTGKGTSLHYIVKGRGELDL